MKPTDAMIDAFMEALYGPHECWLLRTSDSQRWSFHRRGVGKALEAALAVRVELPPQPLVLTQYQWQSLQDRIREEMRRARTVQQQPETVPVPTLGEPQHVLPEWIPLQPGHEHQGFARRVKTPDSLHPEKYELLAEVAQFMAQDNTECAQVSLYGARKLLAKAIESEPPAQQWEQYEFYAMKAIHTIARTILRKRGDRKHGVDPSTAG